MNIYKLEKLANKTSFWSIAYAILSIAIATRTIFWNGNVIQALIGLIIFMFSLLLSYASDFIKALIDDKER